MASQAILLFNSDKPGSDPADSLVASLMADIEKLGLVTSSTSTHLIKETAVLQDIFLQHHSICSCDMSVIVKKPEHLCAVNVGLAAAIANHEESLAATKAEPEYTLHTASASDYLAALSWMKLVT